VFIARWPGRSRREGGAAAAVCRAKARTPRTAAVHWRRCAGRRIESRGAGIRGGGARGDTRCYRG
jgi:hypothetical protein